MQQTNLNHKRLPVMQILRGLDRVCEGNNFPTEGFYPIGEGLTR